MEPEEWLSVVDWESLYEVSNRGQVRSLARQTRRGIRGGNLLTPYVRKNDGYPEVYLYVESRKTSRLVHHLVLEAFVGPCPDGLEALHGPGGKLDATPGNLSWGTRAQNMGADRVRDRQSNRGERSGLAKLTWAGACEIRQRIEAGDSQRQIARDYDVHPQTVTLIKQGKTWAHPPEEW
jgi:hypothetical protein